MICFKWLQVFTKEYLMHGFILSLYIDISVKYLKVLTIYIIIMASTKIYITPTIDHPT